MNYTELLNYKNKIMSLFENYGVENPRVFGSTAMDTSRSDSDVDLLISWERPHSLFDRIRLKNELEELLNRNVDLVTDASLNPIIRQHVLESAIAL